MFANKKDLHSAPRQQESASNDSHKRRSIAFFTLKHILTIHITQVYFGCCTLWIKSCKNSRLITNQVNMTIFIIFIPWQKCQQTKLLIIQKEWKETNRIALRISVVSENPERDDRGKCWVGDMLVFRLVQLRQERQTERKRKRLSFKHNQCAICITFIAKETHVFPKNQEKRR